MLLQLISQITGRTAQGCAQECETRAGLCALLREVQSEIARTERAFDLAEDEALIDSTVYRLKSLAAQQQFLVQNIRRLEGVAPVKEGFPVG
ncbi:MAG: hypothetical protein RR276_07800 [Angelakisella sp.]